MLMITKEHITFGRRENGTIIRPPINPEAEIHLFGQEVNPETWAVSKSDVFMKDPTGRDADNIAFGSREVPRHGQHTHSLPCGCNIGQSNTGRGGVAACL